MSRRREVPSGPPLMSHSMTRLWAPRPRLCMGDHQLTQESAPKGHLSRRLRCDLLRCEVAPTAISSAADVLDALPPRSQAQLPPWLGVCGLLTDCLPGLSTLFNVSINLQAVCSS